MGEILNGIDRARIAALRAEGRFFWVDATTQDDLAEPLGIPEHALSALLEFSEDARRMDKFHIDADRVVFPFSSYVSSGPIEVHVLVSGDYVLTVHREAVALPDALDIVFPEGRSEQYLIYAVLEAMVLTEFDALSDVEDTIEGLLTTSADLRSTRIRIEQLRAVTTQLTQLRRRVAPQRGTFARIADEIERLNGLEPDNERYFDRTAEQINRLVDAIDASSDGVARLIDLRVNETIYWLTVVSTVFLPLTFITGFFGMNFGWMVRHINSPAAFFLLGVCGCAIGVGVTLLAIRRRGTPVE
jgi:magnesium transporter